MRHFALFFVLMNLISNGLCWSDGLAQADSSVLKVGAIYGLTGLAPDFGNQFLKGSRAYLDSKPSGQQHIALVVEDSRWDTAVAVSAFHKLVDIDGVKAVHVMGSGPSLAIKPLAEKQGILLYSDGAHPELLNNSSFVFQHANIASDDAEVLARFVGAEVQSGSVVATIYIQNEWGDNYNQGFERALKEVDPGIIVEEQSHMPSELDFRATITRLLRHEPKAIVVNSTGMAVASIIMQVRQLGFHGKVYANNGLALSRESMRRLRSAKVENVFYQRYPNPPAEFVSFFEKMYGEDPEYWALVAFNDLELLDHAVSKVGTDPANLARFLRGLGSFKGRFDEMSISSDGKAVVPTIVERFS